LGAGEAKAKKGKAHLDTVEPPPENCLDVLGEAVNICAVVCACAVVAVKPSGEVQTVSVVYHAF